MYRIKRPFPVAVHAVTALLVSAGLVGATLAILGSVADAAVTEASAPSVVSAVVPGASAASNFTAIPLTRVVNTPGIALTTVHQVVTVSIAGADGIPTDATAVSGRLVLWNTAKGGQSVNIWDGASGQPGTLTVSTLSATTSANAGAGASSAFQIALHNGKVSVGNLGGRGHFLLEINGYFEAVPAPCVSKVFTIDPAPVALTHVGGSIRTSVTVAGSVDLPAGTYDTRVLGNFTGLNTVTDPAAFVGHQLFGTMVLIKGTAILPDFSNDLTDGGVPIGQADSATLTVDPTTQVDTFLTLATPTTITVGFFAYLDNSQGFTSVDDAGHVHAAIQSAQLRSTC